VIGGLLYLGGMLIMAWNTWKTVAGGRSVRINVPLPQAA
jgi:cytochrome c oxidase cbb3-type subunit I